MEPFTSVGDPPVESDADRTTDERWQRALLPLLIRMLIGVAVFFLAVSLAQLWYLERRIEQSPSADLTSSISLINQVAKTAPADTLNAEQVMVAAILESNALARRHHQANMVLMARVWTSYLGFVTGMLLALVGAMFILGRVKSTPASLEAKSGPLTGSLRTAAPGIVLTALGVALMVATLFVPYQISVSDSAGYLLPVAAPANPQGSPAPKPPKIDFPMR